MDEDAEERSLTAEEPSLTAECGSAGSCEDAGCASANSLDDPTYRHLQLMFRYMDSLMPGVSSLPAFIVSKGWSAKPLCITYAAAAGVTLGRRARRLRRPWQVGWP